NLYRIENGEPVPLHPAEAEFGVPQWVFGLSTYSFLDDGRIAVAIGDSGEHRLGLLDEDGDLDTVSLPENTVPLPHLDTDGSSVSFIAGSPTRPTSVMRWRPDDGTTVLERAFEMDFDQ